MVQTQELEIKKDLEALLPGDIVEVRGGITGEKIPYALEKISDTEVSLLRPNGGININLRIPRNNFIIDEGCVCYLGQVSGDWWTKYHPEHKEYKSQRKIIEQSGIIRW